MRYSYLYILVFCFLSLYVTPELVAQKNKPDVEAYELLKQAKFQMEKGDFQKANLIFRKMLKLNSVLPTEMSYLFAETLYKVGQYENSKNFLEKYHQLTDRGSDYYLLSLELEKQIDKEIQRIRDCQLCSISGYLLVPCNVCHQSGTTVQDCVHCRGSGIVTCSVCTGAGVIITTNQFNDKDYRSCEKCSSKGFIKCPVCEGKKQIETACATCEGKGQKVTDQLCDHLPHPSSFTN
jgi:tetratricopeptide (TPR) repeat protein